jgi:hypothetical protein
LTSIGGCTSPPAGPISSLPGRFRSILTDAGSKCRERGRADAKLLLMSCCAPAYELLCIRSWYLVIDKGVGLG